MKLFKNSFTLPISSCIIGILLGCSQNEDDKVPIADFVANQTSSNTTQIINFTDNSENDPTSWLWDFGDGATSTEQNPSHNFDVAGSYTVSLTATNSYGTSSETKPDYIRVIEIETGSLTDYDGNVYKTVKIGNQWWMAENLRTTHYRNGEELKDGRGAGDIIGDETRDIPSERYYFAYDDNESNVALYGRLYTWKTALDGSHDSEAKGVCPTGWHIPSQAEWLMLSNYLGGEGVSGGKLKSTGTLEAGDGLWYFPNDSATNETGFCGLPAGYRTNEGSFYYYRGYVTLYWSSTVSFSYSATSINYFKNTAYGLIYGSPEFYNQPSNSNPDYASNAYSVRCVKD